MSGARTGPRESGWSSMPDTPVDVERCRTGTSGADLDQRDSSTLSFAKGCSISLVVGGVVLALVFVAFIIAMRNVDDAYAALGLAWLLTGITVGVVLVVDSFVLPWGFARWWAHAPRLVAASFLVLCWGVALPTFRVYRPTRKRAKTRRGSHWSRASAANSPARPPARCRGIPRHSSIVGADHERCPIREVRCTIRIGTLSPAAVPNSASAG